MQIYSTLTPFELAFLFLFLDDGVMMSPKHQSIVPLLFFKTIVIVSIILFTKTELFLGADWLIFIINKRTDTKFLFMQDAVMQNFDVFA